MVEYNRIINNSPSLEQLDESYDRSEIEDFIDVLADDKGVGVDDIYMVVKSDDFDSSDGLAISNFKVKMSVDYYKTDIDDAVQVLYSELVDINGVHVKNVSSATINKEHKTTYISEGHFEIVDSDDLMRSDIKSLNIYDNVKSYLNEVFSEFFPYLGYDLEYKKGKISDRHEELIETTEDNYVTLTIKVFPGYLDVDIIDDEE